MLWVVLLFGAFTVALGKAPKLELNNITSIDPKSVNISWNLIYRDSQLTSDSLEGKANGFVQYIRIEYKNFSLLNPNWIQVADIFKPNNSGSYVVDKLNPAVDYGFRLALFQVLSNETSESSDSFFIFNTSNSVTNVSLNNASFSAQMLSDWLFINFTTPPDVPAQVTQLHVLTQTNRTVWIWWRKPLENNGAEITEYRLELSDYLNNTLIYNETQFINHDAARGGSNLMFVFVALEPATNYTVKVRACSELGCGQWSDQLPIRTLDGMASPPQNVSISCSFDISKSYDKIITSWSPPIDSRGAISGYNITLEGQALFRNENNQLELDSFSKNFSVQSNQTFLVVNEVKPNTNYTVKICAINKAGCGEISASNPLTACSSYPALPSALPSASSSLANPEDPFCRRIKLKIPRISERNGPIKCYKVVMIKLPKSIDYHLVLPPDPKDVLITTHNQVHSSVYDDHHQNASSIISYIADEISSDDIDDEVIIGDEDHSTCEDSRIPRRIGYVPSTLESSHSSLTSSSYNKLIDDGPLDALVNYTGFFEIRILGPNNTYLYKQSNYFDPITSGAPDPNFGSIPPSLPILFSFSEPAAAVLFGIVCGLTLVLLSILSVICFLRKQVNDSFSDSGEEKRLGLTSFVRRTVTSNKPSHISTNGTARSSHNAHKWIGQPIPIQNLPAIFIERHSNSDLLFQAEFEALPENFPDRTTLASELPENATKNRYPDIKCYDQTRVKLTPIDGKAGSDYINANFVEGYAGSKLYICAQGPIQHTITDFWRMIYEYKVSVIVMLTGIEEHGKIKCAQYWDDSGTKVIDNLYKVTLQSCIKYSDFIIRRFELQKNSTEDEYPRDILHFHFLLWKDFLAPEQPSWLLRFIKRVNEHFCPDRGPILIHCSAGVGRTGTFIAIDSLIPEITSKSTVNIFECVSQLRYQRNFLVQSFKQYIFIYRALLEFAQFGDTEIEICHLKDYYRQMKEQKFEGNINGVVAEFDRLNEVIEDPKSSCVGSMDMNMSKNRYNFIIPYDANRVILPPLANKDNSTYINASFVQGYDRRLSFIVTQDPLEITVSDFWRMILEQNVFNLIMLSEIGEGQSKCLSYWPVNEPVTYDGVKILFLEESYPCEHFTVRKFTVTNTKNLESFTLTQYHFLSWKTGVVPGTTSPLLKLIEISLEYNSSSTSPLIVHCSGGGDRSSLFVTIASLIQQINTDGRVDIFQTARYTRSQRPCMLQTIAQYDFIYRCLIDYIDSHNLCDNLSDTQL